MEDTADKLSAKTLNNPCNKNDGQDFKAMLTPERAEITPKSIGSI